MDTAKPTKIETRKLRILQDTLKNLSIWFFWIFIWHVASQQLDMPLLLPSPIQTAKRLFELAHMREFWMAVLHSLSRIAKGFLSAVVLGVLLAVLSSFQKFFHHLFAPLFYVIEATPVASFTVLFLLWVTSKNLSMVVSFLMVLPIIYKHTYTGIMNVDKNLLEMARIFQVTIPKKIFYIYIYHLKPHFLAAFNMALSFAFKAGVAAEVIGQHKGSIGSGLYTSKILLDTEALFAWTTVIILISFLLEKISTYLFDKKI